MIARRLTLATMASLCALVCALALGFAGSAAAAVTEFGEEGEHAGQFSQPFGVAVNQVTGDVFVADVNNLRIDSFDGSGNWLRAWGWDVNAESPAEELQTCTVVCQRGRSGGSAGAYASGEGPHGVAIDDELGSPSYGDVYAADRANYRVEKFGPAGNFILTFGSGVLTAGAGGEGTLTVPSGTCSENCSETITAVSTESRAFVTGQTITAANGGIPSGTTITGIGREDGTIDLSRPVTLGGRTKLTVVAGAGNVAVNEQQTVTLGGAKAPTGGTFTLFFTSPRPTPIQEETAAIAYNAPAASVQAALEALPNIGADNVSVTSPNPGGVAGVPGGPYTVEFTGARYADTNVKQLEDNAEGLEPFGETSVEVATTVEGHSAPADDVCSNAVDCVAGVEGEKEVGANASGQFKWYFQGSYVAVGPGGDVYVGDQARIQVFGEAGAFKKEIPLEEPTFPSYGQVSALAVDPITGEMSVVENFAQGVHQLNASGTEVGAFDMTSEVTGQGSSIKGVALDAETGDLYVEDCAPSCEGSSTNYHFLKYDVNTDEELASFGSKTIQFSLGGMAFANATDALYAAGTNLKGASRVFVFAPLPAGPLIEAGSESGTPERRGAASFKAEILPEGHATTYHVEYISDEQFQADGEAFGPGTVKTTESAPISGTSEELFDDHPVEVNLPEATLVPGTTYHWRFVATDSLSQTTIGEGEALEETAPALIDGPWAIEVTATSAKLAARINPEGLSTSYRLQYGTNTAYGHEFNGALAAGSAFVAIGGFPLQELKPGTTYHFRVVTVNECITGRTCTQDGADHTFTTRPGASEFALPDGRAWELVTPANTEGAVLERQPPIQAASDGSAILYKGSGTLGGNAQSNVGGANVLSRRGAEGWSSQDINTTVQPPKEGEAAHLLQAQHYLAFSPDLASAIFEPQTVEEVFGADALEGTTYVRNTTCGEQTSCYTPLLSSANTPPGTELTRTVNRVGGGGMQTEQESNVVASTPDLAHVVLGSPLVLAAGAHAYSPPDLSLGYGNLYEWSAGRLQLVSVLPNGKTDESNLAILAGQREQGQGDTPRAISSDGRRIAWTVGTPYAGDFRALYVRDTVDEKTVHLGGLGARYQTMSSDGSRVFFLEHGDLYVYEVAHGVSYDAGTTTDLTASHGPGEASAGVQEFVTDASEDGSYVYFVATGVLSSARSATGEKALAGADNLYVLHNNEGGTWEAPQLVATLSSEDEKNWSGSEAGGPDHLTNVVSRVSPDGRYLAFMSSRSLTGYDNRDANPEAHEMKLDSEGRLVPRLDKEGNPIPAHDEEVFLYHAPQHPAGESGSLICASCDRSGARPHGVPGDISLATTFSHAEWQGHWLAGNLPGWETGQANGNQIVYQPRYLSNSGRLFFNSPVALVPHDTNGLEDVYEYEPAGSGGASGCASVGATFNARAGGCVDLISSGQSAFESAFMDASEDGNDVFFLTSDRLTAADIDTGYDVWDAHACSASSPCTTTPVSPPPCSEEACRGAASPQPELFGAPPSATFSGAGNVAPASKPAVKPKVLTRTQQLARALGACRKRYMRSRQRRAACERAAHKRYGHAAKRSRKANATNRRGK